MKKVFRSFAITFSPVEPVKGELLDLFVKYLKGFDYCYGVIEETEEKKAHGHAQVWLDVPRNKDSMIQYFRRNLNKISPDSILKHAVKIKIAYNDDFYMEYLGKGEVIETLCETVPENTDEYYPSQEEQDAVQRKANSKNLKYYLAKEKFQDEAISSYCHRHQTASATVAEAELEVTLEQVAKWVCDQMFSYDTMPIIQDDKNRKAFVRCLYWYIKGGTSLSNMMSKIDFDDMMLKNHLKE
ncbi:MAG: hypothetical protein [Circular genetic element sp.]|nr:MAG: hypothetical protein [Circular genetic element sp.]